MSKSKFIGKLGGRLEQLAREGAPEYQQRLARQIEFLESVFEALQEGIVVLDARLRMRYVNHAAGMLLGLPEEVSGEPLAKYLKGIAWARELGSGNAARGLRREVEVNYPQPRVLLVQALPRPSSQPGWIVVLNDLTDTRRRNEERLESEKLRLLSLLSAGVAHEIGNPLNSLHIHLQLLDRRMSGMGGAEVGELRELLGVAKQEAERLNQILRQFLEAIRSSRPSLVALSLPPLVEDALRSLAPEVRDREIVLSVAWPEPLPQVCGDAVQLRQVAYNLLRNAIQAMSGGGELKVSAVVDDEMVTLVIADTGCGISPAALNRIFEPYYTTKGKDGGSGLGLMVVERIVREHGGRLAVDSEEGRGTVFRVALPRASRQIRLLPAPAAGPRPGGRRGRRTAGREAGAGKEHGDE